MCRLLNKILDYMGDVVKCLRKKKFSNCCSNKHQVPNSQFNEPSFQNNNIYQNPYQVNPLYQVSEPTFTCQTPNQTSMRYHPQCCPYVQ
jgi:hypothetical protein